MDGRPDRQIDRQLTFQTVSIYQIHSQSLELAQHKRRRQLSELAYSGTELKTMQLYSEHLNHMVQKFQSTDHIEVSFLARI